MSRRVKELQMNEFAVKPSLNPEKFKKDNINANSKFHTFLGSSPSRNLS